MNKVLTILLLLLSIIGLKANVANAAQEEYIFELVSKNSGFTYSQITCIATDKNNMLWFACNGGLYYHDTNKFTQFKHNYKDENSIPSDDVNTIFNDSNDRLWIATRRGLCYFDNTKGSFPRVNFNLIGEFDVTSFLEYKPGHYALVIDGKLYAFTEDNLESLHVINVATNAKIYQIYNNEEGTIYVGCEDGSIYIVDSSLKAVSLLYLDEKDEVTTICESNGRVYIGYENSGIDVLRTDGELIKKYRAGIMTDGFKIPSNNIRTIKKRTNGELWVGTESGIVVISPEHKQMSTIVATEHNQLPRNSIYSIHVDDMDNVWIGTWAGSIAYYNDMNYRFRHNTTTINNKELLGVGTVHHFETNDDSTIWVANEWTGLSLYNFKSNKYESRYIDYLRVKTLKRDSNGNLWIGTIRQGLYFMDYKTHRVSRIEINQDIITDAIISAIMLDEQKQELWLGTRMHGLINYNLSTKKSRVYNDRNTKGFTTMSIWGLDMIDGDLYICSDEGLSFRDGESNEFVPYNFLDIDTHDHCAYSSLYDKQASLIYVGTKGNGVRVFDLKSRTFKPLSQNTELSKYQIYGIEQDSKRELWFSTNNGIYQYSPLTDKLHHFTHCDGLQSMRFHPASQAMTSSDVLFFGSIDGFYYINTNLSYSKTNKHSAFISSILVNGEALSPENCISQNSYLPSDITKLTLSPKNNSLAFGVVSNNMLKSEDCIFRYRLNGYQNDWADCGETREIIFTKLPFGKYQLEIQTRDSDEQWSKSRGIEIKIETPVLLRWYMLVLYIVIVVLIVLYAIKEASFRIKAKRDVEVEREINIINNRSFDEKVKFFMNISHELRTPLSLIKAPLDILEKEVPSKESQVHINAIKRNTERLLRLTTQILDFRLLEVGKLKTSMVRCNVVRLCQETYEYFGYQIKEHRIDFTFEQSSDMIFASLDEDMVGKVVYNLLGNAFKYSDDGTAIKLRVESCNKSTKDMRSDASTGTDFDGEMVLISIEDAGRGIPENQLYHIFERFYFNTNNAYSSSGIGLHMCMEYVNLHSGKIMVESNVGKGTKFTVALPVNTQQWVDQDNAAPISITPYELEKEQNETVADTKRNQHKSTVLIVDDNSEIRFYLKKMLSRTYNCVTAKNGQQGLEMAQDIRPQIIIMDVLMPIMGGVECVQKLREHDSTKIIPIIMLTGITDDNTVIQGVKSGVDAYLSKPINESLLFAHIERLLLRNNLVVDKKANTDKDHKSSNTTLSLSQNIERIIEQNIQNNTLDVNFIAEKMKISRSTLQRNFKNEMDVGIAEFIRDYRLRSAVELMKNGAYNIDELSMCVGFNSSSYFCKAFKDKYGKTPKRYLDSLKTQE